MVHDTNLKEKNQRKEYKMLYIYFESEEDNFIYNKLSFYPYNRKPCQIINVKTGK